MNCAAVSVVIVLLTSACSSAPIVSPGPTVTPTASLSPTVTPTVAVAASPLATRGALRPLGGQVVGAASSDRALPSYSVQVPAGWSASGEVVTRTPPKVMGLSVWDAIQVPTDPCRWSSTMTTPGPTVDDLVKALVAQRTRNASAPVQATLAGYKGVYLEWSVPPDMVDGENCDKWPDNGYRDFVSFLGVGGSERYEQLANQIDRLWVLDVNGHRLVVDATYSADATAAQKTELGQVAGSLRFDEP
jgi:hypothetical protein